MRERGVCVRVFLGKVRSKPKSVRALLYYCCLRPVRKRRLYKKRRSARTMRESVCESKGQTGEGRRSQGRDHSAVVPPLSLPTSFSTSLYLSLSAATGAARSHGQAQGVTAAPRCKRGKGDRGRGRA